MLRESMKDGFSLFSRSNFQRVNFKKQETLRYFQRVIRIFSESIFRRALKDGFSVSFVKMSLLCDVKYDIL